jgi:SAM-dependent methyltransferase
MPPVCKAVNAYLHKSPRVVQDEEQHLNSRKEKAMSKEWTADDIMRMAGAYQTSCVLLAGVQLDLFTVLDSGPREETGLAAELGCPLRSFDMLLTALEALGLVRRENGVVSIENTARALLSRNSPDYLGFIIRHHGNMMSGWQKLTQAVYTGSRTAMESALFTQDAQEREDFLMGMYNVARLQADRIARTLDLSGRKKLLDIGGGPGAYAVFFCQANPELECIVFDLPTSEPFARKIIARYDLEERIHFVAGDYLADPLPKGQDVAWLSQVLHGETPGNATALVQSAAKALNSGGLLCIQEFVLDDDRKGPPRAALFDLNMLVGTDGGQVYTVEEICRMMKNAGARNIREPSIALPESCRIFIGDMP